MLVLALGLLIFLAVHSVPMAPRLRGAIVGRLGLDRWRAVHSLVAALGLGLIVWGFALARAEGWANWLAPEVSLRHATLLLMMPVFPLLFAAYLPGRISATIRHPMVTAVILWSAAHLMIVASAPAVLLFAAFLAWSVADRLSQSRRRLAVARLRPSFGRNDLLAIGLGLAVYGVMVARLHLWLIGVSPLG